MTSYMSQPWHGLRVGAGFLEAAACGRGRRERRAELSLAVNGVTGSLKSISTTYGIPLTKASGEGEAGRGQKETWSEGPRDTPHPIPKSLHALKNLGYNR